MENLLANYYSKKGGGGKKKRKQMQVSYGKLKENQIWKNHMVDCFPGYIINYIAGENTVGIV